MAVSTPTEVGGGAQSVGAASSLTYAATLATGDLLVVLAGQGTFGGSRTVTGVTWNGIALTKAIDNTTFVHHCSSIWYLHVTSGATANIVVTISGTSQNIKAYAFSVTGHDSASPIGDTDTTAQTSNGTGVEPTLTLTGATAGDLAIDILEYENDSGSNVQGAGQTEMTDVITNHGVYDQVLCGSYEAAAGSSVTMSYTRGQDRAYTYCAAVIKQAAGGGASIVPMLTTRRIQAA